MIKKFKSSMSLTAKMPAPKRDIPNVGNRLLRIFKTNLPASFPMPARSESNGQVSFKFSPDRKIKTKQIVAAILEALPETVLAEVSGVTHNTISLEIDTFLGTSYQETLTVMANDNDPESKLFIVILGN